jgi:hypothetical protein
MRNAEHDLEGADMRYQPRFRHRLGRLALTLALGLVGVFGLLTLQQTPHARAASQGSVFVYPPAGGPGTRVRLELNFFGDQQLYQIKVATKPTDKGGCDTAQALSGDGGKPVQLGGQDATRVEFDWPGNLASNAYYFCVFPMSTPTAAPTATATATATGTPVSSPAATATPKPTPVLAPVISGPNQATSTIPFDYTRDASATVALPNPDAASAAAGAQIDVTLTKWLSQNRAAPTSVVLAQVGQSDSPTEDAPVSANFTVTTPPDTKGNCKLSVTIPATLNSGHNQTGATQPYLMIIGGPGIFQRSDPFAITPSLSPTVPVSPTATGAKGGSGGGLLPVLGWIVAVLAFLGAIGGVLYLALNARRAKGDAPQPQRSAPWGAPQQDTWGQDTWGQNTRGGGPQGKLWEDTPPQGSGGGVSTNWGQGPQGPGSGWDAPTEPGRWPEDRR